MCVGCDVRVMSGVSSQMTISSVSLSCGSAGLCSVAQKETEKNPTVTEIVKWDTLTAHVIVKYRLMGNSKAGALLNTEFLMNAL